MQLHLVSGKGLAIDHLAIDLFGLLWPCTVVVTFGYNTIYPVGYFLTKMPAIFVEQGHLSPRL